MRGDCLICTSKPALLVIGSVSLRPEEEHLIVLLTRERDKQASFLVHHLQIQAEGLILCW